ncbi:serine hydrolase domain-containing protein [Arenimonas sp.]|uniref:serine hydrolase domain-containing protein n=1 Tax=Arenimonas sp. TaxID=1872635 RepID=UPI0035AF6C68
MKIPRNRRAVFLLVACTTLMAAQAQAGVVRLSPSEEAIDAVFARYDSRSTPGCSVAVIDDGKLIFQKSYGMADVALGVERTAATSHWLPYSEARVFVALAVAMLARDGQLGLDDAVRKHVPELPAYASAVTVRQLLHHTSGLADYGVLDPAFNSMETPVSEDEFFRVLHRWGKLGFAPGQGQMYSNTDYGLLTILVERKTGSSLHDYLHAKLLGPLGMDTTRIGASQAPVYPGHALFNQASGDGGGRVLAYRRSPTGGISVTTNLEDLVRWDAALRDPARGLSKMLEALEEGAPPRAADAGQASFSFGVFRRDYRGIPLVAYHGVGDYTWLVQVPGTALSVATLCNVYPGMESFGPEVARLYVGPADPGEAAAPPADVAPEAIAKPGPPVKLTASELQVYAGEYRNARGNYRSTIRVAGDSLEVTPQGRAPLPLLTPVGDGRFTSEFEGSTYVVTFRPGGEDMMMSAWDITTNTSGGDDLFRWTPPAGPTAARAVAYAGTYEGEDIDAVLYVRVEGSQVFVASRGMAEERLEPTDESDVFKGPSIYTTRFERDESGRVPALVFDATRVKGMRYKRR